MKIKNIILDGKVVYEPHSHSIYHTEHRNTQLALAIPASLCLLALLQRQGEIVSHSELLSVAWEARGINVSPNTLYQNISILRKSLETIGLKSDIIKTVPKRGFVIPDNMPVEFVYEPSGQTLDEAKEKEPTPDDAVKYQDKKNFARDKVGGILKNVLLIAALGMLCFYIFYALAGYKTEYNIPQYIYPDFVEIPSIGDCHAFRNYSLRNNQFFTDFITRHNLECGKEKWWYLISYPPSLDVSLFRCDIKLGAEGVTEETSLCLSDFYRGKGQ